LQLVYDFPDLLRRGKAIAPKMGLAGKHMRGGPGCFQVIDKGDNFGAPFSDPAIANKIEIVQDEFLTRKSLACCAEPPGHSLLPEQLYDIAMAHRLIEHIPV